MRERKALLRRAVGDLVRIERQKRDSRKSSWRNEHAYLSNISTESRIIV